jgi:hypothetical protein
MVGETGPDIEELTMITLLYNIPLMILFFALWVGIPAWLVVRHPDSGPQPVQPPALAHLPAQHHDDPSYQQAA